MKRTFMKFLPIAAAVLLATSCSKDDNSTVVDQVVTPAPVQEEIVAQPTFKTIFITGKVSNNSLSKVTIDDAATKSLKFQGTEVFAFGDKDKDAVYGTISIKDDKGIYEASISFKDESSLTSAAGFTAYCGSNPELISTAYDDLSAAVEAACYKIDFKVTGSEGTYSLKDKANEAQDIKVENNSAFVHAFCDGIATFDGKEITIAEGKYYIVPTEKTMGKAGNSTAAGKVYKLTGAAAVDFVDLGIVRDGKKVFWATKNVGADKPWEYGDYFAWGETVPFYEEGYATTTPNHNWRTIEGRTITGYNIATYQYGRANGASQTHYMVNKYCPKSMPDYWYGSDSPDDLSNLVTADDVAYDADKNISMPESSDFDKLNSQCYWVWVDDYNGKSGNIVYKVKDNTHKGKWNNSEYTSLYDKTKDPHIFLPAAGYRGGENLFQLGTAGYYWSSSLDEEGPETALRLNTTNNYRGMVSEFYRDKGLSVRPVRRVN